jgi:hypothetical protein
MDIVTLPNQETQVFILILQYLKKYHPYYKSPWIGFFGYLTRHYPLTLPFPFEIKSQWELDFLSFQIKLKIKEKQCSGGYETSAYQLTEKQKDALRHTYFRWHERGITLDL